MDSIEKVQAIGDLVCEGCDPSCGVQPKDCERVQEAIEILEDNEI